MLGGVSRNLRSRLQMSVTQQSSTVRQASSTLESSHAAHGGSKALHRQLRIVSGTAATILLPALFRTDKLPMSVELFDAAGGKATALTSHKRAQCVPPGWR